MVLELGVAVDDVQNIENLTLVLMKPLDLDARTAYRIHFNLLLALDQFHQAQFVFRGLDLSACVP